MHRISPLRSAAPRLHVAVALALTLPSLAAGATLMGDCPGVGDCCVSHSTPGCNDFSCCNEVCAQDPFCCTSDWDSFCVGDANELCTICGPVCGDTICEPGETWPECPECPRIVTCPGVGDCCDDHLSNGCTDEACCNVVCEEDPSCCQSGWDVLCVNEAHALCDGLCTPRCGDSLCEPGETWPECPECPPIVACPGVGDCCVVHLSIGCTDEACCDQVCAIDAFCCDSSWDAGCVGVAQSECPDICGTTCGDTICEPGETWPECPECPRVVSCPGTGDCCSVHASPGCDDTACCEEICTADPACCDTAWDGSCVKSAGQACGCAPGIPEDLDGDGSVGQADLAILLGDWGSSGGASDIDGDGEVGQQDLALLLGAWDEQPG